MSPCLLALGFGRALCCARPAGDSKRAKPLLLQSVVEGARDVPTFTTTAARARFRCGLLLLALAAAHSAPAAADHNFGHATDLGKTTSWESDGKTLIGDIPAVEGTRESYHRFSVEVAGTVFVSGVVSPRIFNENRVPLSSPEHGLDLEPGTYIYLEPGTYYVVFSANGAYRVRLQGGGRGHDDFGNVMETAQSVELAISQPPTPNQVGLRRRVTGAPAEPLRGRIDYSEDRDYFKFVVPEGTDKLVRIWLSDATSTDSTDPDFTKRFWLQDEYGEVVYGGSRLFGGAVARAMVVTPGTYYLLVRGRPVHRGFATEWVTGPYWLNLTAGDDHGNLLQNASRIQLPSETTGTIDYNELYSTRWSLEISYLGADIDSFWFQVESPGRVGIGFSGPDVEVSLYDSEGKDVEPEGDGYPGAIFSGVFDPGVYYVVVRGNRYAGSYKLHLYGEVSGGVTVPLLPSDDAPRGRQGFVRIINHSGKEVEEVKVTAFDDTGREAGSFTLENLGPWQTVHFNSRDLELGNRAKGINNGVGRGEGSWYLEVAPSEPEVEVLSYIRTPDGFLTSMHDLVPSRGIEHRVAVFNPGSNRAQASRLRLLHPRCPQSEQSGCSPANVAIFGVDDAGKRSPDVRFQLASGVACEVTAAQLEGLDPSPACLGGGNSLGDGDGKWQLFISADQHLHVMSLLDGASGHLTNLSAPASSQAFATPAGQSGTAQ